MIDVCTELDAYRVATAELPLSARSVSDARSAPGGQGEIRIVDGAGEQAGRRAWPSGAAAIVLSDPAVGAVPEPADGAPVVVDREWLRSDIVTDAKAARAANDAALFTAECAAPSGRTGPVLRDAIGWLRELSGEDLVLRAVRTTAGGAMALLDAGDRAVTVLLTELSDPLARPWLRALAIGAERTEVEIDDLGAASVTVSSETGMLRLPARRESRQRLALRRAITAVEGADVPDLPQLRRDDALATEILQRINSVDSQHSHNRVP